MLCKKAEVTNFVPSSSLDKNIFLDFGECHATAQGYLRLLSMLCVYLLNLFWLSEWMSAAAQKHRNC